MQDFQYEICVLDMNNNICQFQGVRKILIRTKERPDKRSKKSKSNTFQSCWKELRNGM